MPRPVPYQQTFLRQTLGRDLTRLATHVLCIGELNRGQPADQHLSMTAYFNEPDSDRRLYLPVPTMGKDERSRELYIAYQKARNASKALDLVGFLNVLADTPDGVLLASKSGSGKTVGALACLVEALRMEAANNRLAGYLPCWVDSTLLLPFFERLRRGCGELPTSDCERRLHRAEVDAAIPHILLNVLTMTANVPGIDPESPRFRQWLRYSPPLLLFFDLNAFPDYERRILPHAIVAFQREYGPHGHRVVVAYRDNATDAAPGVLRASGLFRECELLPLPSPSAEAYLRNWRNRQDELAGQPPNPAQRERELHLLRDMVRRHVQPGEQSLISTPILMHLVSLLPITDIAGIRCLADLYRAVTDEWFHREQTTALPNDVQRFHAAMGRVALAILARHGGDATRLTALGQTTALAQLQQLWTRPHVGLFRRGDAAGWHPTDRWWIEQGIWFKENPAWCHDDLEFPDLLLHSLLRREGEVRTESFGFLHDSFLYYYAALTLAAWRRLPADDPENALDTFAHPWFANVIARFAANPEQWRLAMEFLGGMLPRDELLRLFPPLLAVDGGWKADYFRRLLAGHPIATTDRMVQALANVSIRPEVHRDPDYLLPHARDIIRGEMNDASDTI